jgi:hypothetical protein
MSFLLPTNLPLSLRDSVDSDTFNQLVRILELNLGRIDVAVSPSFTLAERDTQKFASGAIIFNTTTQQHQAFDGTQFRNLYDHQTYPIGQSMTASVGSVTVS